jgi:hypothetical protein
MKITPEDILQSLCGTAFFAVGFLLLTPTWGGYIFLVVVCSFAGKAVSNLIWDEFFADEYFDDDDEGGAA